MVPSTCVSVNTRHTTSVLGATTTTRGRRLHCNLRTFYYGGFRRRNLCAWCHGLALGKGSGLLDSRRWVFLSSRRAGFFSFPGQIDRLPAQYKIGGQQSTITKLQVLLRNGFHLQARPDNSHGRSAKYAGNVDEPSFHGRLPFSLICYWFSDPSSRAWLWPALLCRHLRLGNSSRPLCHLRHKLFYGGGWTAASSSRLAHYVQIISLPLINGVG
jgi:hypothetical protein